jgi:hypothetical protein
MYTLLTSNKHHNIFTLTEKLSSFRNILAHNALIPLEKKLFTWKKSADILKATKSDRHNHVARKETEFYSTIKVYNVDETLKEEIFKQLEMANAFFRLYLDFLLPDAEKTIKDQNERAKLILGIEESDIVSKEVGVFKVVKKIETYLAPD